MCRTSKLVLLLFVVGVCAGSRPNHRATIRAPRAGNLTLIDGEVYFSNSKKFDQAQWYLLGTQIKFKGGGYLTYRTDATPSSYVYISPRQPSQAGWEYDQTDIVLPAESNRRLARIKATAGPLAGYYLSFEESTIHEGTLDPAAPTSKFQYQATLVRDRQRAPIFEMREALAGESPR